MVVLKVPLQESPQVGHESIKTTERHYAKWVKARQDRLDTLVIETWKNNSETNHSLESILKAGLCRHPNAPGAGCALHPNPN